jgi:hypothetical protein
MSPTSTVRRTHIHPHTHRQDTHNIHLHLEIHSDLSPKRNQLARSSVGRPFVQTSTVYGTIRMGLLLGRPYQGQQQLDPRCRRIIYVVDESLHAVSRMVIRSGLARFRCSAVMVVFILPGLSPTVTNGLPLIRCRTVTWSSLKGGLLLLSPIDSLRLFLELNPLEGIYPFFWVLKSSHFFASLFYINRNAGYADARYHAAPFENFSRSYGLAGSRMPFSLPS